MLQSYSEVLAKIHTSVRSLGSRLEEIEHTRSKKVKGYKKKLARAIEKYRQVEERCRRAEAADRQGQSPSENINNQQY